MSSWLRAVLALFLSAFLSSCSDIDQLLLTPAAPNSITLYGLKGAHQWSNLGHTSSITWLFVDIVRLVNKTGRPCFYWPCFITLTSEEVTSVDLPTGSFLNVSKYYSSVTLGPVNITSRTDAVCCRFLNCSAYLSFRSRPNLSACRPHPGLTPISRATMLGIKKINNSFCRRARKSRFALILLLIAGVEPNPVPRSSAPTRSLRFGLLNTRSAVNKAALVHDTIADFNLDMFALTETWVVEADPNTITLDLAPAGFSITHVHRNVATSRNRGGGIALIHRNSIQVRRNTNLVGTGQTTFESGIFNARGTRWLSWIIMPTCWEENTALWRLQLPRLWPHVNRRGVGFFARKIRFETTGERADKKSEYSRNGDRCGWLDHRGHDSYSRCRTYIKPRNLSLSNTHSVISKI